MRENKFPSYAQLLDYYKRTKTEDTVLTDYVDISIETRTDEAIFLNTCQDIQSIRRYAIELALKNYYYGNFLQLAEQILNYIMEGKLPEDVKLEKTPQEYFTRKDVEEIGEAHINFEKGIAVSKD